jgi:hypothetical protein
MRLHAISVAPTIATDRSFSECQPCRSQDPSATGSLEHAADGCSERRGLSLECGNSCHATEGLAE